MGVGTSLGATFDDSFHQSQNQWNPDKYPSTGEIAPPAAAGQDDNVQSDQWTQQQRTSTANTPIQIADKVDAISIHPAPAEDKPADTGEPSPAVPFSPSRFSVVNAFRGMLNGSAEAVKNLPQNLTDSLKAIGDTVSLPHDVMTGDVPAGSIQEIEKAADLGMMMVGGPSPVAAKMADGTLGSFAGVKATGIDKTALYKAQEMEMNGLSKDEIWNQTGFFRGAEDNRWKFEIPDKDMKLKPEAFDTTIHVDPLPKSWTSVSGSTDTSTIALKEQKKDFFGQSKPVFLNDVVDHPELFKQYPALKNIKVEPTQPFNSNLGGYGVQSNTLYLKQGLEPDFAKSVIMHEVQHAIQEIEGFSKGGSPKQFKPPKLDELIEDFNKAKQVAEDDIYKKNPDMKPGELGAMKGAIASEIKAEESNGKLSSFLKPYVERAKSLGIYDRLKNIVKTDKIVLEKGQEYFDKYHQLHGEIEARNVQARMKFDYLDRQFNAPFRFKD